MELENEILKEHSKTNALRIASWIGEDKRRFKQLMELFLKGQYRTTQRSAWILTICAENHPQLVVPHLQNMIARMQEPEVHDAVRRNVLRILQDVDVPPQLWGTLATLCFDYLTSDLQPIAIRVFSMSVLANIAQKEPDLKNELRIVIEQHLPYGSAGFSARARHVLKILDGVQRSKTGNR